MQPYHIRVDSEQKDVKLDPLSRLDFARPHPIDHRVKVKSFGKVNRDSEGNLLTQWRAVILSDSLTAALHRAPMPVMPQAGPLNRQLSTHDAVQSAYEVLISKGWTHQEATQVLRSKISKISKQREDQARAGGEEDTTGSDGPVRYEPYNDEDESDRSATPTN